MSKRTLDLPLFLLYGILVGQSFFWSFNAHLPYPDFIPESWSTGSWNYLLSHPEQILHPLYLSLLLGVLTTLLTLLVSLPAAWFFTKNQTWVSKTLFLISMLPLLTPILVPAFGLYETIAKLHLTGSLIVIAFCQSINLYPYMLYTLVSGLSVKGMEYYQQAQVLGNPPGVSFLKAVFPTIIPSIIIGSFFVFTGSINDYLITYLFGDAKIITLPIAFYPLISAGERGMASACSILFLLPLILVIPFAPLIFKRRRELSEFS